MLVEKVLFQSLLSSGFGFIMADSWSGTDCSHREKPQVGDIKDVFLMGAVQAEAQILWEAQGEGCYALSILEQSPEVCLSPHPV